MFSKILKDKINTTLDSEAIETLIYAAYDIVVDEGYEFENGTVIPSMSEIMIIVKYPSRTL